MFAKNIPAVDQPGFVSDPNADLLYRLATELVCEKLNLCFFAIRGTTNNVDKIVEIGQRDQIALECFSPGLGLAEKKTGTPENYVSPVLDIAMQCFFE